MKMINKVVVVCSICLLAGTGSVAAACNQADAKGTWRVHAINWNSFDGAIQQAAFKCKLKIGSEGEIVASKSACKVPSGSVVDVTGGHLVMAGNCKISGNLDTDGGINFTSGQMDRSKNSFTILGESALDADYKFFFDGIKQ